LIEIGHIRVANRTAETRIAVIRASLEKQDSKTSFTQRGRCNNISV